MIFPVENGYVLFLAVFIFLVGLIGVAFKKSYIAILLSLQMMFFASIFSMVFLGQVRGSTEGSSLSLFILFIAVLEGILGFVIGLTIYREQKSLHIRFFEKFKG